MNERIKELYDQALESKFDYGAGAGVKPGEYYSNYITVLNPEKFAELIVRECIKQGDTLAKHYIDTRHEQEQVMLLASIADYSNEIKRHFGVEE